MSEAGSFLDFAQHRAPIYMQLATLFRRFIVTGQWPLDSLIPRQDDLATQFEVNAATVRKTISILESEGLLRAVRRRGTVVLAKPTGTNLLRLPTTWRQVRSMFAGLSVENVDRAQSGWPPAAWPVAGEPVKAYRRQRRVLGRDRMPLVFEELYLDAAVRLPPAQGASGDAWLAHLDRAGLARQVDQTIRFGIANREVAQALELPLNEPVVTMHCSVQDARHRLRAATLAYFPGSRVKIIENIVFGARAGGANAP